ncbi:hypothetical protein ACH4EC_35550 [Streptomyces anulatus]
MCVLALQDILGEPGWAAATGREIRFTELTGDQARWQWRVGGWPEEGIEFMLRMWATVPETVAGVTSGARKVSAVRCHFGETAAGERLGEHLSDPGARDGPVLHSDVALEQQRHRLVQKRSWQS